MRSCAADIRRSVAAGHHPSALARSDLGHVVVLAQPAQVLVEFLYLLLVCFDSLLLQSLLHSLPSHLVVPSFRFCLLSAAALSYRSLCSFG